MCRVVRFADAVTARIKTYSDFRPSFTVPFFSTAYYERYRNLSVDMPRMVTWKADVVAEVVMKCLKMKHAPSDLLIGTDARFVLPILRMLPAWCSDFLFSLNRPPIPAAMKAIS